MIRSSHTSFFMPRVLLLDFCCCSFCSFGAHILSLSNVACAIFTSTLDIISFDSHFLCVYCSQHAQLKSKPEDRQASMGLFRCVFFSPSNFPETVARTAHTKKSTPLVVRWFFVVVVVTSAVHELFRTINTDAKDLWCECVYTDTKRERTID